MFLEACKFDFNKKKLVESEPNVMFEEAPVILLTPTEDYVNDKTDYMLPLYKTIDRSGELSTTG